MKASCPWRLSGASTLALSSVLAACGGMSSLTKSSSRGSNSASAGADQVAQVAAAVAPGSSVNLTVTASYSPRPVDVIIIRGGRSHDYFVSQRLDQAAPVLSARLFNLGLTVGNVHLGIFDQVYGPNDVDQSKKPLTTTLPINGPHDPARILLSEGLAAKDFDLSLRERLSLAGSRGGRDAPASVLKALVDESQKPGGGNVAGLLRPDAFWAVLLIAGDLNPLDPLDTADIIAATKSHKAGMAISTLAVDRGGCTFADSKPPQPANPNNDPQRNLEIKLQELTGGVFGSACASTYSLFMDDFAQKATGSQYFAIPLANALVPSSVKITGPGNVPVLDYRYVPGTTTLEVSTQITPGMLFSVSAVADVTPPAAVVSTAPGDPAVPTARPNP